MVIDLLIILGTCQAKGGVSPLAPTPTPTPDISNADSNLLSFFALRPDRRCVNMFLQARLQQGQCP